MTSDLAWEPTGYYQQDCNVAEFLEAYGYDSYNDLIPDTETELSRVWGDMVDDIGVEWREPYDDVVDTSDGVEFAHWFRGGKLNATETILDRWVDRRPDQAMYVWTDEAGNEESVTYVEMAARVGRLANALRDFGIERGDVVGITFPMHPNGFVAALACLRIGAVFTQIFPGYGPEAMGQRLEDSGAKLVVTVDGYQRDGSLNRLTEKVARAVEYVSSVSDLLVYEHAGVASDLEDPTVHDWTAFTAGFDDEADPVVLDSDDTAFIAYSSGTTGKPKGTIHTHASLLAMGNKEGRYHFDASLGDTFLWVTDYGWVIVPIWMMAGAPALGATTVLMEGAPFAPDHDRIWRTIDAHDVNVFGIAPTGARTLRQSDPSPRDSYDLSSLRVLGSTGEPWDEDTWSWFLDAVGGGEAPIINASGGTELAGAILSPTPLSPLKPGTLFGPAPGVAAEIYDEDGQLTDEGYLVIEQPIPGLTHGLTSGDDRYLAEYWETFDGVWNQNDWAERDADGFWYITGRADDTMNIAGRRVTAPAIEEVINAHPAVSEAAVVGVPHPEKGQTPVAFVTVDGITEYPGLAEELSEKVASELGGPFRPSGVYVVEALPRTQTGKIPREILRDAHLGEPIGNTSTLDNGAVLEEFPRHEGTD